MKELIFAERTMWISFLQLAEEVLSIAVKQLLPVYLMMVIRGILLSEKQQ